MPRHNVEQLLASTVRDPTPKVIEGKAERVGSRPHPHPHLGVVDDGQAFGADDSGNPNLGGSDLRAAREFLSGPLAKINTKCLNTKQQVMEQLNNSLPLNKYNLPDYIYRADMVDHGLMLKALGDIEQAPEKSTAIAADVHAMLTAAMVEVDYSEGYPRILETPFWYDLPWEPKESYTQFQAYLDLGGVRQLHQLIGYDIGEARNNFHMYLWSFRVKAYDMYVIAHHQKLRIQRALSTEDKHYRMAEGLITQLKAEIQRRGNAFLEGIEPDKAVAMLEKLVRVQRISVGLAANGDSGPMPISKTPTVTAIMEEIAEAEGSKQEEDNQITEDLMNNPEALEQAQNLIVSLQEQK
jgi:hypothetical protein